MTDISIIVPAYKVELYIQRCINSIINQTFEGFQMWLVDDGSSDSCGSICDDYALQDERIQVIHKKNGGLSDARNKALDVCASSYICFVDSDDWIPEDSLETMYDAIKRNNADIAIGNMIRVDEEGNEEKDYCPVFTEIIIDSPNVEIFDTMIRPCAPNRLYRRCIFTNIRYPVNRLYEDCFVFHHILEKTKRIVFTGQQNYFYFIRNGSIMHSSYTDRNMDIIFALDDRIKTLDRLGYHELANENRMFIYSKMEEAYRLLDPHDIKGVKIRKECKAIYDAHYPKLLEFQKSNLKQFMRLILLRYAPKLHSVIYKQTDN